MNIFRISRLLHLLNALFWLFFGVLTLLGAHPSYPQAGITRWAIGGLTALCGLGLGGLYFWLNKPSRLAYWLSVLAFAGIAISAVLDELGWADYLFIVFNLLTVLCLLLARKHYLSRG